ncbi:hypothetical protein G9C98_001271 [Cotesia typhae]|uniref:Uncharacterized protein n=1 Tax=Cotesia typhae TaxID=2053667 RepID=A0A8J5UNR8_9HYME|nr:hypothetical protein G9C98_001271 [Cotesia typhae]
MNDTSLWERVWYSHGTCGNSVPAINSQYKYFNKTLELFNKYDIQGAFESNNITIGNEYDVKEILAAIERTFGKHGMTACKFMAKISKYYLHEVSLCFDKTFNLIHCDGVRPQLTDCPRKKLITIPNIKFE